MGGCACLQGLALLLDSEAEAKPPMIPGFRVKRVLGFGGFAVVWRAEEDASGQQLAVKCMEKARLTTTALSTEIEVMQAVEHRNVVELVSHFEDASLCFLALELCLGGDVLGRIGDGCLSEADSAAVLLQGLLALRHVHGRGIVHRDVKPENLLLAKDGPILDNVLKLADFGLATWVDPKAPRGITGSWGTALFAAPEVYRGPYGVECDLWSAGVLLFMCLSGDDPFPRHASEFVAKPQYGFAKQHWDGISRVAKRLVCKLMEPDASKRLSAGDGLQHAWFLECGLHMPEADWFHQGSSDSEGSTACEEAPSRATSEGGLSDSEE